MTSYTDVEKQFTLHCEDRPVLSLYLEVPLDPPTLHGLPARAGDLRDSAAGGPCGPVGPDAGRVLASRQPHNEGSRNTDRCARLCAWPAWTWP